LKSFFTFNRILVIPAFFLMIAAKPAFAQHQQPHVFPMNPSGKTATGQTTPEVSQRASAGPLTFNGGPVLHTSTTYAIFWGWRAGFPSDLTTALPEFLGGFGSSVYANILDQYFSAPGTSQFHSTMVSVRIQPPTTSPSVGTIVNRVCSVINRGALPLDPVDPTTNSGGVYFVLTSSFPPNVNFCAWHSAGTCNGQTIAVAYIPNLKNVRGCNPGNLFGANSFSEGTRADVNVMAHELSEALTDPELNAWFDSQGNEIGDKCAWNFASAVTLFNGSVWQLQEEWSNTINGCAQ
jgi:hypothetical protein